MASSISGKVWRKLHISVGKEGVIVANEMTNHLTDDRACTSSLLNQAEIEHISEMLADGGYDSQKIYHCLGNQ